MYCSWRNRVAITNVSILIRYLPCYSSSLRQWGLLALLAFLAGISFHPYRLYTILAILFFPILVVFCTWCITILRLPNGQKRKVFFYREGNQISYVWVKQIHKEKWKVHDFVAYPLNTLRPLIVARQMLNWADRNQYILVTTASTERLACIYRKGGFEGKDRRLVRFPHLTP